MQVSQVSVETTEGLGRRMKVQVPAERVEKEVNRRLSNLTRTVRVDGFRPGKVPLKVVKGKFGSQVRAEVVADVVGASLSECMMKENLRPAGRPEIEATTDEAGKDLEYEASFEVYPVIELAALEGVTVEKPQVEIADADMDKMMEKLVSQQVSWDEVDRAAADGDQLDISFVGKIDGEVFTGGTADNVALTLGSGAMIPGFEAPLIGAKAGEERNVKVTFPEDYQSKDVAGKEAEFDISVNKVSEQNLPELNDALAESFGITEGGIEKLRAEVRANMERELAEKVNEKVKQQVMDALVEKNNIDLPTGLVQQESEAMMEQMGLQMPDPSSMKDPELVQGLFSEQAKKRVALGLILAEISGKNDIKLDPTRLQAKVESMAATYEDPQEFIQWFANDAKAKSQVESLVLEEQVVEWVLDQVEVKDVPAEFDEIMNPETAA